MSWASATIAPTAIFGWNRMARNTTTAARNTSRAISAWSVMSRPQSALTDSGLTWSSATPAASAMADTTVASAALSSVPVRSSTVVPPTTCAVETCAPASSAASRMSTSWDDDAGTRKLLPPSKSMPKLNPRKTIEAMQTSTTTAVTLYQNRLRPTTSRPTSPL